MTNVTVVYEIRDEEAAQQLLELFKTRKVMEGTGSIVACCQGDAMQERDAYKGFLERHGYSPEAIVSGHVDFITKMETLKKEEQ